MKKFNNHTILVLGFLLSLTTSVQLWANPVDVATARRVAFNFMRLQGYDISSPKEMANVSNILGLGNIYVFNTPDRPGYVVVSADDCCTPILAFSSQGFFPEHPHRILRTWYNDYNNLIEALSTQKAESAFASRWEALLNDNQAKEGGDGTETSPAKYSMTTEWGTGAGYNKYCPFDPEGDGYHANAGSLAVAAAQIINYWGQKPSCHNNWNDPYENQTGTTSDNSYRYYLVPSECWDSTLADNRPFAHPFYHGTKTYDDPLYGTQYANFGRSYDFDCFPDKKDQPYDPTQQRYYDADSMALFIYHVGVSLEMQYDKVNSLPRQSVSNALADGLGTHWGYENSQSIRTPRMYHFNSANSSIHYKNGLKRESRFGRPFILEFKDTTTSYIHYSVCDGYYKDAATADEYAHLNLCDGGDGNAFYNLIIDDSTYIINGEAYGSSHYIEFQQNPPHYTPQIVLTYIYSFTPNPYWFHTDKDYAELNEDYGSENIRVFVPSPYPPSTNFILDLDIKEYLNRAQSGLVKYTVSDGVMYWFAGRNDEWQNPDPVCGFNIKLNLRKSTPNDLGNGNPYSTITTVFDNSIHETTFRYSPAPWSSLPQNTTSAFWNTQSLYEDTTFTIPIYYSTFNTPDTIICDNGEFDYAVSSEDLHSEGCRIQQHWGIAFAPELFSGYDTIIGFQYYATDTEPTCGIIYETNHGYLDTTAEWPYQCRGQAENCQATEEGWNTHLFSTPRLVSTWTSNGTKPFWIELSARNNGLGAWAATSTGSTNSSSRSFLCRPSENENGSLDVGIAGEWNTGEWTEVTGNIQWMIRPLVKGNSIPKPYKVKTDFMECPNISWYAPENYRKFQIVIGEKGYIPGNADSLASIYVPADECDHEQGTNYFEKHLCDLYYGREEGPILQDGKDYDAYIRIIGDYNMAGPWSDPGTLEAPCYNIQQLPFSEDFKNGCPRCWTDESEGYLTWLINSGLWIEHLYNPDSTVAAKDGSGTGSGSEETFAMLVTPEIDFSSITPSQIAQLSFLQRQTCAVQADTDYMDVLYRVFEGYPIYDWSAWTTLKRDTVTNTNIEAVVIDLPSPTSTWATIQFAFNINVKKSVMAVFSDLLIQAVPRPATPAPDNAAPPMYPNPSAGVFTVDCPDVQEIEALDVMGRSVKKVVNTNVIDITNRPPGTYMLRVTTGAGVSVGKVSKK